MLPIMELETEFDLFDVGEGSEHNGDSCVEIAKIFVKQSAFFHGVKSFNRV